jgi:hypothetical protein
MINRQTGSVSAPLTPIWDAVQESRNPFASSEVEMPIGLAFDCRVSRLPAKLEVYPERL